MNPKNYDPLLKRHLQRTFEYMKPPMWVVVAHIKYRALDEWSYAYLGYHRSMVAASRRASTYASAVHAPNATVEWATYTIMLVE